MLLIKEEEKLNEELKEAQAKSEEISQIHNKILSTIRNLIENGSASGNKFDESELNTSNNIETSQNQETRNETEGGLEESRSKAKLYSEDDMIVNQYCEFLKHTKKKLTDVFLSVSHIFITFLA